jgi:site-specific recombinase XerC
VTFISALELLKHKDGSRSGDTELLFPSEAPSRLNANNISRSLHLALVKAKMTNFHFHDLRHTCATRMVQAGVDLYKVQRLLGHKSPTMTQRYAHHYPESLRAGIEVLDAGRVVSTNLYMDPAFAATTVCHAMHQVKTGLRLYIRPLGGPQLCPGLDEIRARSPY